MYILIFLFSTAFVTSVIDTTSGKKKVKILLTLGKSFRIQIQIEFQKLKEFQ